MLIGVPREIKPDEHRVALTPAGTEALTVAGHQVLIEADAGLGSGFTDDFYAAAGAESVASAADVWSRAEMILKVKEPIEPEWPKIREGQVLFTYLHLASSLQLTEALCASGVVAIAYETVELPDRELPLLTPMSEVAGRMAVQEGAKYLERHAGGRGVLLGGVPGVLPGKVVILGGGVVGMNAALTAAGLGATVALLDVSLQRLRYLAGIMPANVNLLFSTRYAIRKQIRDADLVIGAVLLHGAKAPSLIVEDDLKTMKPGSVIVDVAVDQGGCVDTIRPTTHGDPIYTVHGVIHYGVANMPGGVPRTSTLALTNATLPYALMLADLGWRGACLRDPALALGVNIVDGRVTYPGVAEALSLDYSDVQAFLTPPAQE
ncbi:MAG: alanine dehydrogenase [Gemmatimonadetes bacterium]|nr:alanine dehydrogenase [Gemmatimonadota bacterium]